MSEIKQVIVMRTKYPDGKGGFFTPRKGKMIAQGAHASMKVFFDAGETGFIWRVGQHGLEFGTECDPSNGSEPGMLLRLTPEMVLWVEGLFTKVCTQVNNEEALHSIVAEARAAGLPVALIEDAGQTEFHGVKTATCCAVGPADAEAIDRITGGLRLL